MRLISILIGALFAAAPAAAQDTPPDTSIYEVHQVEVLPQAQNAPEYAEALRQAYPPHLREAGVSGTVQMSFIVGPDGRVRDVHVLSASDSAFSAPSVQAMSVLRFVPAQAGGRPVAVRVEQPIHWRVHTPAAVARTATVPDSVHLVSLDSVDVRPLPRNLREFEAAVGEMYPAGLRGSGARAQVLAGFAVDPDGAPQYAQVLQSTDPRFDAAALKSVGMLRFEPARRDGAPVWVWMEMPLEWSEAAAAAADSAEGYELHTVNEPPRLRNELAFQRAMLREYPPRLRGAGIRGDVQVRFRVDPDGRTSNARVLHSTDRAFNEPTLRAVAVLRFDPAKINGRPVPVWVVLPITWTESGPGEGIPARP